jgi:hypothetical protein
VAYSATTLVNTRLKADAIWADAKANEGYKAEVIVADALRENDTSSINRYFKNGKEDKVELTFIKSCPAEAEDCTDSCEIEGEELSTEAKTYAITMCKEKSFVVPEVVLRGNDYDLEMFVARGLLDATKVLDNAINKAAIAAIQANLGVNVYGGIGTIAGTNTTVLAELINSMDIIPQYLIAGQLNNMSNPYVISGMNSYLANWNAEMNRGNADGKGNAARSEALKMYFDIKTVEGLAPAQSFLVNRGAFAFASRTHYEMKPTEYTFGQKRWKIESRNLRGVYYDVHFEDKCVGGEIYHAYKVIAKFEWLHNPLGCTATEKGVLRFTKGA